MKRSLYLRPFTEDDIPTLLSWIPSREFLLQWSGQTFSYPLDPSQIRVNLEQLRGDPPAGYAFCVIHRESGNPVGHVELINVNRDHGYATATRVLVGPASLRGRGLGGQLMAELLDFAFGEVGLHRVQLHVYQNNTAAIACYRGTGFRQDGILREHTRHGDRYLNSVLMSILDREWSAATI